MRDLSLRLRSLSLFFSLFFLWLFHMGCGAFYTLSGTLSGLDGTVVLQNNGGNNLSLSENGTFTFAGSIDNNSTYSVTVLTQPSGQTCTVTNGTGTISNADVSNVLVTCVSDSSNTFTVGGTLSNLGNNETVVLQDKSGESLTLTTNGVFNFPTALEEGTTYEISVLTEPSRQTCLVSNASGTVSGNVTNIGVICTTTFPIFFETAVFHTGNLGGISGADSICMSDSNKPVAGTYKAFLVDGTNRRACSTANCSGGVSENIDWVLAPSTTYYQVDGTTPIMTTNSAGIFVFGTLTNSFLNTTDDYWTGLQSNWTPRNTNCTLWTSDSGGVSSSGGTGEATNNQAILGFSGGCDVPGMDTFLLCVEQ